MGLPAHLYFHSPCFDGIVSAVLAWDFLENKLGWTRLALHSVNYDLKGGWLSSTLEKPCAIVDFLYHPEAEFWADHHLTAFLSDDARRDFERRKGQTLIYDDRVGSCATLLWRHLAQAFGYRNSRYAELVTWAEKTDAARYESVAEAIFPSAPALKISLGLVFGNRQGHCETLVRALREQTLDQVAGLLEVQTRFARAQNLIKDGLSRFEESARLEEDGILVFDVDSSNTVISRYAPFYFYPAARYSAGIVRWKGGAKITAMRNPWREFESVPLGKICEQLGGGGHRRVGSVVLQGERAAEAPALLKRILSEIRREERETAEGRAL